MWQDIFSQSNRTQLSLLRESLKEEQAEVSALFNVKTSDVDLESLLKMAALRAHRCSLILQNYGLLFQINQADFNASLAALRDLHSRLLLERSRLAAQIHFRHFSRHIDNCLSIIKALFEGRLDTSPKNNLMTRYLCNLKNCSNYLQNLVLLVNPEKKKISSLH